MIKKILNSLGKVLLSLAIVLGAGIKYILAVILLCVAMAYVLTGFGVILVGASFQTILNLENTDPGWYLNLSVLTIIPLSWVIILIYKVREEYKSIED